MLSLRYDWQPSNLLSNCKCGVPFSVEDSLSCPKRGFTIIRYSKARYIFGQWMTEMCNDVQIVPPLQPLSGETLSGATAISDDGARLDITANGLWGGRYKQSFFDVCIFNLYAPSN